MPGCYEPNAVVCWHFADHPSLLIRTNNTKPMIEPVALSNFFLSFFTAAMIILTAALYAAVYAWGEITDRTAVRIGSLFVYALLLVCVVVFVNVANLTGYWQIVAVLMTLGYWWMPRFIWRLCVATHADEPQH